MRHYRKTCFIDAPPSCSLPRACPHTCSHREVNLRRVILLQSMRPFVSLTSVATLSTNQQVSKVGTEFEVTRTAPPTSATPLANTRLRKLVPVCSPEITSSIRMLPCPSRIVAGLPSPSTAPMIWTCTPFVFSSEVAPESAMYVPAARMMTSPLLAASTAVWRLPGTPGSGPSGFVSLQSGMHFPWNALQFVEHLSQYHPFHINLGSGRQIRPS